MVCARVGKNAYLSNENRMKSLARLQLSKDVPKCTRKHPPFKRNSAPQYTPTSRENETLYYSAPKICTTVPTSRESTPRAANMTLNPSSPWFASHCPTTGSPRLVRLCAEKPSALTTCAARVPTFKGRGGGRGGGQKRDACARPAPRAQTKQNR